MELNKIAIYMKDDEFLNSFFESNRVLIFSRKDGVWIQTESVDYCITAQMPIGEIRRRARTLTELLGDCRVIAGLEMLGIPFSVFDMAGYHIFTVTEINSTIFEEILADIENGDAQNRMREEIIKNAKPVETDVPGMYFLDLILLQTECPEISSKKALRDFLESTPFLELKLICKHLPPWLELDPKIHVELVSATEPVTAIITKTRD